MTRTTKTVVAVVCVLGLAWLGRESALTLRNSGRESVPAGTAPEEKFLPKAKPFSPPVAEKKPAGLSPEKRERLAQIRRDYEEMRAKMSQEYGAAGEKFPGGLNAFLRQLALLEREMHADFAKTLTPQELEDYEMAESNTGKILERRFAGLLVTDEQRRAVYRAQREFDDQFALVFDVSPGALLERMKVQQVARAKIRAALGDDTYAAWLKDEDPAYAAMRNFAAQKNLPATASNELWQIKDEWTQRKLEIASQPGLTPEQRANMQAALAEQTRTRVLALAGSDAFQAGNEPFAWLPPGT